MFLIGSSRSVVLSYGYICGDISKHVWMHASWILLVSGPWGPCSSSSRDEEREWRGFPFVWCFSHMDLYTFSTWECRGDLGLSGVTLLQFDKTEVLWSDRDNVLVFPHLLVVPSFEKTYILLLGHLIMVMQGLNDVVKHLIHFWVGGSHNYGSWRPTNKHFVSYFWSLSGLSLASFGS